MSLTLRLSKLAVPVFLFLCAGAWAQEFEVLEQRLLAHPAIEALDHRAEAHRHRAEAAHALPDPVISMGVNSLPIADPAFDAFLPTHKALSVRQAFPSRDRRSAAAEEALRRADRTEAVRAARLAELRSELIVALIDKQRIARQRGLAEQRRDLHDELTQVVETEIDAGRAALSRLDRIEAGRTGIDRFLIMLDEQEAAVDARLTELVHEVPETLPPSLVLVPWSGEAGAFHDVHIANLDRRIADALVDRAEAAWQSDWGAQLTYQQREPGHGGPGSTFAGDDFVSASLSFSVPLWADRSQVPGLRAAEAEREAARREQDARARQVIARYTALDSARHAAEATVAAMEREIGLIEKENAARLTVYQSGAGDYSPIIDGDLAILVLRTEIVAAEADARAAIARLQSLAVTP